MNQEMNQRIVGAAPAGAPDRESAAAAVREMFTSIAPRYDLLNHVLSFNIDRWWGWRGARAGHLLRHRRHDFRLKPARWLGRSADSGCGFFSRHAAARSGEGRRYDAALDRSRCASPAVSRRTFQSGDVGIRLSKPGRLRSEEHT